VTRAWLLVLAGCLPLDRTTPHTVERVVEADAPPQPGTLAVRTVTYNGLLVVDAAWPRTCTRRIVEVVETTTVTEATLLRTSEGDVTGYFLFGIPLVLMWPLGVVDAGVTEAIVLRKSPKHERKTRVVGIYPRPCPVPARDIALHVTLSSGARFDARTDERGRFALLLPVDTTATVTTDSPPPPPVDPLAPVAPVAPVVAVVHAAVPRRVVPAAPATPQRGLGAVMSAAVRCAAALGLPGTAKITISVDANGKLVLADTNRGSELTMCVRAELARVVLPTNLKLTIPVLLGRPR